MKDLLTRILISFLIVVSLSLYYESTQRMVSSIKGYQFARINSQLLQPVLCRGDTATVNRRAYMNHLPSRGDIVLFRSIAGQSIDRIIGIPGDTVEFHKGLLFLNNKPAEKQQYPLNIQKLPEKYFQKVPEGRYLLRPTYLRNRRPHSTLSLISRQAILGKVIIIRSSIFRRQSL